MTTTTAVTVRPAVDTDIDPLVALARAFLQETPYGDEIPTDDGHLSELFHLCRTSGVVLVAEQADGRAVGLLAGIKYRHHLTRILMASEQVWFVDPSVRGQGAAEALVRAFEDWGRSQGATRVEIGSWHPRLDRYYTRLGYQPRERIFIKELSS